MKKPHPDTDLVCRSLLQKAVRRGDTVLVEKVARHLHESGDKSWLRARVGVIIFEECWLFGTESNVATDLPDILKKLIRVVESKKMKGAAGLGSLAYALSTGDDSVLLDFTENRKQHIIYVSDAIKEPKTFWAQLQGQQFDDRQSKFIDSARKAWSRASWPWDKAFTIAGTYLATRQGIPEPCVAIPSCLEVPLWVALDKHTPQGKTALRNTAKQLGIESRKVAWMSFYCESAITNDLDDSYWWQREIEWRLGRVHLDYNTARHLWKERVRTVVIEHLREEVERLQEHMRYLTLDKPQVENPDNPHSLFQQTKQQNEEIDSSIPTSHIKAVQIDLPGF